MDSFIYKANPARVVFGSGTRHKLPEELEHLKVKNPLIVCTHSQVEHANDLKSALKNGTAHIFPEATMHTPANVTAKAQTFLEESKSDSIVSLGGGSAIGLGKALSIRTGLPHISIPTTYAGSEMTEILGETVDGQKKTRRDPKILPTTVIYDVELTLSLPTKTSATSGINAIAHGVEALYATNTNPIIQMMAREGIKALASSLPTIMKEPSDTSARSQALYGAWLCSTVLGVTSMALHHKLCHVLGGSFNLPHAETHAAMLPHAVSYNYPATPDAMRKLADVLPGSNGDAVEGLNVLLDRLGIVRALSEFGMKEGDVDKAVGIAMENLYENPRKVEEEPIRELIRRAWKGERARADL